MSGVTGTFMDVTQYPNDTLKELHMAGLLWFALPALGLGVNRTDDPLYVWPNTNRAYNARKAPDSVLRMYVCVEE